MGHQNKEMDVESLQQIGRRRGGCLDMFLVMSIIFLFVAVTAVAAGGAMLVIKLHPNLEPSPPSFNIEASKQTGGTSSPAYKMHKFVELEATSSELKNFTMQWAPVAFAAGTSLGSNYLFDPVQSLLKPKREGMYFIYIDLNLTCTFSCSAGVLSVRVDDKLTCEVKLQAVADSTPVSRKCWTVSRITKGQGLLTQMTVPEAGLQNWRLEMSSRFGMFLVD
ncbi:uncharacterized protein LOC123970027 [Micropterus dolomieu]|uniref:uncharacterized protein LOC123970027 n=1 Tax=Micropterus dolomieu TaxID=147949 RepID=UPI001E8CC22C|nr:uncharacterized protein LOC123970027 [Micropterus dolomieu]